MLVFDSHLDLSWNALNWNRDLTAPLADIRASEAQTSLIFEGVERRGRNTVSFPEMRKAEVAVCLATLLARSSGRGEPLLDYRNTDLCWAMAQGQLAFYRRMEQKGEMRMLRDFAALDAHVREWQNVDGRSVPLGFILAMEGADPILSASQAGEWFNDGLRVLEPVHFGVNAYAHGTGDPGGLTPAGRDLLKAMEEAGIILDITHLADEAFWQALELYRGPVMASHHNCRALVPGDRQLTDGQIRSLIERGAVIGAACDAWMLYPGYVCGRTPESAVRLSAVADHIDHVCQIAGNTRHSGIGSDLDGGFGAEQCPAGLDTIADLQQIASFLRQKGYRETDIESIMWRNWFEFFRKAWSYWS